MRIFATKTFDRWARKENLSDQKLLSAIVEMEAGQFEANLGGNVYKKRIAAPGKGKRGSYRTIIAFKSGDTAIFIFGYAKRSRDNIDGKSIKALKALAALYFGFSGKQVGAALDGNQLREILPSD